MQARVVSGLMANPLTYAAFLRGINVGGAKPVAMARLAQCIEGLGYRDVKTYINSGNVVFRTTRRDARAIERVIESELERAFSTPIRVFVRNVDEMRVLVDAIKRRWRDDTGERQNVIFLSRTVDGKALVASMSPKQGLERVTVRPGALLWSVKKRDLTKSEMLKLNRMPVYQEMTVRGPGTVRKVYELMLAAGSV